MRWSYCKGAGLQVERSRFETWVGGSVSCVPGQNTFYLHWSISRYWRFVREASWNAGRWPYGGLVSHPCGGGGGGVPYGNWDNLPLNGPLGSSADFTFTLKPMTLQLSNLNCKWYPIGGLWKRVGSTLLKAPILFYVSLSASALINNHHSQHARINLSLAPFLLTWVYFR